MRSDEPFGSKFKRACTDFPNLEVLTKSSMPKDFQVTYLHASVGDNSLGEKVGAFALVRSLKAPSVVLIDIERDFAGDGEKIRLPTTEALLRAASGRIAK